ncbi:MAG TPA: glycosyltransferase family 4 protein [Verrucomicrobiae bacterium]
MVAQKGAREHFLAARALYRRGMLAQLVTDWYVPAWCSWLWPAGAAQKPVLRRLSGAMATRCPELPDRLVRPNRLRGLIGKWTEVFMPTARSAHDRILQADRAFIDTVAGLRLPPHDVFFGYSYASLEVLEAERARGVLTVLDQIDPGPVEFRLVAEEMAARPELAGSPPSFPKEYYDRLKKEWELADVIAVNSEWSRKALIAEGAEPGKIEILPLAYEAGVETLKARSENPVARTSSAVRVLWLGQVNVRKGIHYLIEAARALENEPVHFDVVGPIAILPGVIAAAPRNMTFHGAVSRDQAAAWYRQADVFVLPTLSDGFALTQLEALTYGVPVIATPNCAEVVAHGQTGFIVPARDARALADAISEFVRAPGLSRFMSAACRQAVQCYSIDAYGQCLAGLIERHAAKRMR